MAKQGKIRKVSVVRGAPVYSPRAQELRALLRRVPDGFQATLQALAARPQPEREQAMAELARGMGKEILPLIRAAALGTNESLACSAVRVLPVLGTRAAGDVLAEVHRSGPESERARLARESALALEARGIRVPIPDLPRAAEDTPRLTLRETTTSAPDGAGSRAVTARLQDRYGVWHAAIVLWNDRAGVKAGGFMPLSRQEWMERQERLATRGDAAVPCPPDYARWQVERARRLNEISGFPLEDSLAKWDLLLGPPPTEYAPPDPLEPVRAAGEDERLQWLNDSRLLFETPEVRRWFLEAADCAGWARKWEEVQRRLALADAKEAPILNPLLQEVQELVRSATAELVTPEQAELHRDRLLDVSRVFEMSHQTVNARRAAVVALELEEGVPPSDLPFFIALVQRSMLAAVELSRRGEDLERLRYQPLKKY